MVKVYKPKNNKKKNKKKNRMPGLVKRVPTARRMNNPMSRAVTQITTAPVAIGNTIRGSESKVRGTRTGVVVNGRDFMFTAKKTASSIVEWCTVGGTPITPVAFGDTVLRQYLQMYQKYRWRSLTVHYITSSSTATTGDVLFYHGKNRSSVYLNQTSSFFMPYVISDPDTIFGVQWTNHSANLHLHGTWKSTDYGMTDDLDEFADGEVFLLSKTASTDSPGYVLFDYEIEFDELQISPRLFWLPLPRAQYNQFALKTDGSAKTQGQLATFINGTLDISGTSSSFPPNYTIGDIYKIIIDNSNSTYTTGTNINLLQNDLAGAVATLTLSDGFTCYALATSATTICLFPNSTSAYASGTAGQAFAWGASLTFNVNVQVWASLIGTQSNINLTPNY
jgi:hypothetical protein